MPPDRQWTELFEFLTRRRLVVLALSLATAGICTFALPTIPFITDPAASLPADSPAVQYWVEMSRRFEAFHTLMVGLEEPGAGLSREGLAALDAITRSVDQEKELGVRQARSLTNMVTSRRGPDGGIEMDPAVAVLPETPEDRTALHEVIRNDSNLRGAFVSPDGRAYLVIVQLDPERAAPEATARIREIVEKHRGPLKAVYYGAPFVADAITARLAKRAPRLVAVGAALFLVPLLLIGWRILAVFVVLLSAGASVLLWFGLLELFGITPCPGTGLAVLPVVAVAAALFARATEERISGSPGAGTPPLARRALLMIGGAVLALAGVAFVTPSPVTEFASAAAVGMVAVFAAALLVFVPASSFLRPGTRSPARATGRARPIIAVILGFAVLGVGVLGATQCRFRSLPRHLFFKEDPVGRSLTFFDTHFGGADLLQIHAEGDFSRPEDVARLLRLSDCLEGALFSDVRSLGQVIAFLNQSFQGVYRIPKEPEALGNLWFFLEGNNDIRSLVVGDRSEAMIVARIPANRMDNLEEIILAARRAERCSIGPPEDVARRRLEAIRGRLTPRLPATRVDAAVDAILGKAGPGTDTTIILGRLRDHMASPEAPFEPDAEEWAAMAAVLRVEGDVKEKLTETISGLPGFKEMEYPDGVAARVADELLSVRADAGQALRIDRALVALTDGIPDRSPEFDIRARGVLTDLQDGVSTRDDAVRITISGSPVVAYELDAPVVTGVWKGATLIWVLLTIFAWAVTRRTRRMIVVSVEVGVATLYTFTLGWILGLDMDPASAPLYLLPPLVGFFVSPWLYKRDVDEAPAGNRFVSAFTVALASGSLTLLHAGVLPLVRVGAVTALGLGLVTVSSAVFRKISD